MRCLTIQNTWFLPLFWYWQLNKIVEFVATHCTLQTLRCRMVMYFLLRTNIALLLFTLILNFTQHNVCVRWNQPRTSESPVPWSCLEEDWYRQMCACCVTYNDGGAHGMSNTEYIPWMCASIGTPRAFNEVPAKNIMLSAHQLHEYWQRDEINYCRLHIFYIRSMNKQRFTITLWGRFNFVLILIFNKIQRGYVLHNPKFWISILIIRLKIQKHHALGFYHSFWNVVASHNLTLSYYHYQYFKHRVLRCTPVGLYATDCVYFQKIRSIGWFFVIFWRGWSMCWDYFLVSQGDICMPYL